MGDIEARLAELKAKGREVPEPVMIKNAAQIAGIRKACKLNSSILDEVAKHVKVGMKTNEIDKIVYEYTISHGGRPSDLGFFGYPKSCCTSVNNVICHGIPCDYVLKNGDIVNVDLTTELDGYFGDASRMFMLGRVSKQAKDLVNVTRECMRRGIRAAQAWNTIGDIGAAIGPYARKHGYSVMSEYGGHGVGLASWEDPYVCHVGKRGEGMVLVPGMVITIEPMVNMGAEDYYETGFRNWEVHTADGSLSAQWESTILITENGPEVLSE